MNDDLLALVLELMGGPEVIQRLFDETFSPGVIPPALAGPNAVSSVGVVGTCP